MFLRCDVPNQAMKPKAEKLCALLESAPDAKRAEEALIEERHLLHTLMDNLPDLIYFKDRESRFTRINLAHANAFGLSHPDQAVGKSDFDFFTPEHAQEAYGDEQEIIRTGQPIVGKEEKETWPDGRVTWVSTTKMPLRNPHGDITGTFGVSCDITQRKRAEEALRRSEEKYRSFVSNIPDVAWTMDARLHIAFISPNIERISGYTLDEVYGQGARLFLDSVHPDDLQNVREGFEALFAKNQPYDVECRLRRKNGEWIWMHDRALKTYEKDGIRCADGLLSDITERKRAEAALRESETKYRTIFESAADAIFLFDGHGFVQCSERALELFRCTRDHIVGQTPDAISPAFQPDGSDSKQSAREISRRAFSGEKVAFEWQYRRPDGTLFDSETRLSSLQIDGETYLLAVVSDITERKRAEAEMTERHRLATLVAEVGRVLTQSETLRQGLQQCTEILVHNIGAAFARVWTVNEEENVLELQASAGIYTHLDGSHARVPVGKFKIGRIAESCEPHLTNSVLEDPWVGDAEWARREGIVAFAGYPLKVEEHVLGVVAAFARQPLMETTLQAFASVADSIAQFIRRKHAEQQTALQTVALESAANGIVIASRDGRINWVNPAFTRLTGYPAAEVIGKNPRFLKSGIHDKAFYQKLWNTILSGEVWQGELVNRRKDGTRYPEEMTITPVRDAQGTLSHFIAIKQDITARKRAEQDLLFKTALLEAQSETTIDGILVVDMTGQVLLVNRQFAKMWGFPEETIRTKDDRMLIEHLRGQVKDPEAFVERVHYLYTHKAERSRDEIELKSGRIFDRYSSPLQDSTGKHYGRIWYFRDITGRREIDRLKSELVSVVSHELRTPLTSIRGALGLLAGGLLRSQPEKGKRMLEIAISNTDRLVRLINDILDLERMESGKMNMEKRPCIATDMMTEAADNVRELAEKAGVTLSVSPYPSRIWVDPDRLIQAFVNLLSNAIKFSARGGTVWLSATPQANQILFQVKDQGRGIPQEKLESIFERFQQVDASDRREKGGTGLGLPITRSIVQQHGGRICVKSTLGQGTTFSFTLPSLPAETTLPADGLATRKVLMCAVEADICNTVPAALKQGGYTVMVSSSWHEAVETATLDRPEAILLDSSLPGMEGLEPIDAFKQNSDTQDIPLIGLGGKAPSEVQLAAMGMAGWIAKPLNEISLIQGLEPVLAKASDRPRVLLIEDDADLAGVLTTVFERHGAVVFHAQTGQEGVQICPKFIPDLLVLDVLLPELDGFGVVEQLRQYENLRRLPVAVYSVKELNDSEKARLRLGESIFLTKSRLTPQEFEERAIGLLSWATSGQRERRRG